MSLKTQQKADWKKPVRNNPSTGIEHEGRTMFAVIRAGGKQYRVAAEDIIRIDRVKGEPGEIVEFGEVLVVGGDTPQLGTPTVSGATVAGEVLQHTRGDKVIAFKKRRRKNSRRKRGYRHEFSVIRITEILTGGAKPSKEVKPRPKREAKPKPEGDAEAKPAKAKKAAKKPAKSAKKSKKK
jgi:large subunit ribosomal protein L21